MIVFLQDKNVSFIFLARDGVAADLGGENFQSRATAVGSINFGARGTCNLQKSTWTVR